ncbi:hypothetical protein M1M90_00535 [Thermodesulfovibrionales bacterium]|nr:hypothetical protein [Thermodesulfovibrionales bacterium]
MISKSCLAIFIGMDDPGKKNLRLAIKEMALVSSRKVQGKGNIQFHACSARMSPMRRPT